MGEIKKYNGAYQELFEMTGDETLVKKIHKLFWGENVKFPKYLHSSDYVMELVLKEDSIKMRKEIAKAYGYTYDTIVKKIRKKSK